MLLAGQDAGKDCVRDEKMTTGYLRMTGEPEETEGKDGKLMLKGRTVTY